MRPSFLPRLVNGALFDPVVYVRIMNEKRALMFDCGHFLNLSERELLAVETLCISHLHMDHFMGFDRVLRSILHRQAPLDIYGPDGIIEKTLAKLTAYSWNLTRGYGLEIRVHEVMPGALRTVTARADEGFAASRETISAREGTCIADTPRYCLQAAILDHGGIPCLAYVLKEPFHINIKKGALEKEGYDVGEWIGRLKDALLTGRTRDEIPVSTSCGVFLVPAEELGRGLVIMTGGQSIGYVTDIACTEENLARLESLADRLDMLFIEAYYLEGMEEIARGRGHLTTSQAAMIARRFRAKRAFPMHISPRYHDRVEAVHREMGLLPGGRFRSSGGAAVG